MKKLISVKEVKHQHAAGNKIIYTNSNTIVTPAARDTANSLGMKFSESKDEEVVFPEMDSEKFYKVLKVLMEKGALEDLLQPYKKAEHSSGFSIIYGQSIQMESFDTGKQNTNVCYRQLIDGKAMKAGILSARQSCFDWTIEQEEISYVIDGKVMIHIEGATFEAQAGDVLHFPLGTKVAFEIAAEAKFFYVTQ